MKVKQAKKHLILTWVCRLQHEVSVLQQQLCESRSLVHSLQCELQVKHSVCAVASNTHSGEMFL